MRKFHPAIPHTVPNERILYNRCGIDTANSVGRRVGKNTLVSDDFNKFDVLKFVEIDLQTLFPGLYVHVLPDVEMEGRHAFLCTDHTGIVVSDTIYEAAGNGCLFSCEKILHEVGHLFLHSGYSKGGLNSAAADRYDPDFLDMKPYESIEWQATEFAKCFLYSSTSEPPENYLSISFEFSDRQLRRAAEHHEKVIKRRHRRTQKTARWAKSKLEQSRKSWKNATSDRFVQCMPVHAVNGNEQLSFFG